MSKKHYQALARAIWNANCEAILNPHSVHGKGGLSALITSNVADALAADNPRFDRARFIEACETGRCKGMRG